MLRKLKRNKRGIVDTIFLLVSMLGLAIFIGVLAYTIPKITEQLMASDMNTTEATSALMETDNVVNRFDAVFLIVFAGSCIGILITSFMIKSHPIFIPVYIFLLAFTVILAVIFGNVYETFETTSDLNVSMSGNIFTHTLMNNLVMVSIGVGILSMIILFATPAGSERL